MSNKNTFNIFEYIINLFFSRKVKSAKQITFVPSQDKYKSVKPSIKKVKNKKPIKPPLPSGTGTLTLPKRTPTTPLKEKALSAIRDSEKPSAIQPLQQQAIETKEEIKTIISIYSDDDLVCKQELELEKKNDLFEVNFNEFIAKFDYSKYNFQINLSKNNQKVKINKFKWEGHKEEIAFENYFNITKIFNIKENFKQVLIINTEELGEVKIFFNIVVISPLISIKQQCYTYSRKNKENQKNGILLEDIHFAKFLTPFERRTLEFKIEAKHSYNEFIKEIIEKLEPTVREIIESSSKEIKTKEIDLKELIKKGSSILEDLDLNCSVLPISPDETISKILSRLEKEVLNIKNLYSEYQKYINEFIATNVYVLNEDGLQKVANEAMRLKNYIDMARRSIDDKKITWKMKYMFDDISNFINNYKKQTDKLNSLAVLTRIVRNAKDLLKETKLEEQRKIALLLSEDNNEIKTLTNLWNQEPNKVKWFINLESEDSQKNLFKPEVGEEILTDYSDFKVLAESRLEIPSNKKNTLMIKVYDSQKGILYNKTIANIDIEQRVIDNERVQKLDTLICDFGTENSMLAIRTIHNAEFKNIYIPLEKGRENFDEEKINFLPTVIRRDVKEQKSYINEVGFDVKYELGAKRWHKLNLHLEHGYEPIKDELERILYETLRRGFNYIWDSEIRNFRQIDKVIFSCPTRYRVLANYQNTLTDALKNAFGKIDKYYTGMTTRHINFYDEALASVFSSSEIYNDEPVNIACYDFGGGTSDFVVLNKDENGHFYIFAYGSKRLGGVHVSAMILQQIINLVKAFHELRIKDKIEDSMNLAIGLAQENGLSTNAYGFEINDGRRRLPDDIILNERLLPIIDYLKEKYGLISKDKHTDRDIYLYYKLISWIVSNILDGGANLNINNFIITEEEINEKLKKEEGSENEIEDLKNLVLECPNAFFKGKNIAVSTSEKIEYFKRYIEDSTSDEPFNSNLRNILGEDLYQSLCRLVDKDYSRRDNLKVDADNIASKLEDLFEKKYKKLINYLIDPIAEDIVKKGIEAIFKGIIKQMQKCKENGKIQNIETLHIKTTGGSSFLKGFKKLFEETANNILNENGEDALIKEIHIHSLSQNHVVSKENIINGMQRLENLTEIQDKSLIEDVSNLFNTYSYENHYSLYCDNEKIVNAYDKIKPRNTEIFYHLHGFKERDLYKRLEVDSQIKAIDAEKLKIEIVPKKVLVTFTILEQPNEERKNEIISMFDILDVIEKPDFIMLSSEITYLNIKIANKNEQLVNHLQEILKELNCSFKEVDVNYI